MSQVIGHFLPNGKYGTITMTANNAHFTCDEKTYSLHGDVTNNCRLTFHGHYVCIYNFDSRLRTIYDLYDGSRIFQTQTGPEIFAINDDYFVSFDNDTLYVWLYKTNTEELAKFHNIKFVSMSLNKTKLAVIAKNNRFLTKDRNMLIIYDLQTLKQIYAGATNHSGVVAYVDDFATYICDLTEEKTDIRIGFLSLNIMRNIRFVIMLSDITFSPDGSNFIAQEIYANDNRIKIYLFIDREPNDSDLLKRIYEIREVRPISHISYSQLGGENTKISISYEFCDVEPSLLSICNGVVNDSKYNVESDNENL